MLANDLAHGFIRKALLVIAEQRGRVDACEDRCLPRRALRSSFDAEARIRANEQPVVREFGFFVCEDGERRGGILVELGERIMRPARADAETVTRSVSSHRVRCSTPRNSRRASKLFILRPESLQPRFHRRANLVVTVTAAHKHF